MKKILFLMLCLQIAVFPCGVNFDLTVTALEQSGKDVLPVPFAFAVLTNDDGGVERVAFTNPFGRFVMPSVEPCVPYTLSLYHREYRFAESPRSVSSNGEPVNAVFWVMSPE